MSKNNIKTDFAVFSFDAVNVICQKHYLPQFAVLAEADFQNSRGFGQISPFFVAIDKPFAYPEKDLQTLSEWQKNNQNDKNYTQNCFLICQNLIAGLKQIHQKKNALGCLSDKNILIDNQLKVWFGEWSFLSKNDKKTFESSLYFDSGLVAYLATELTFINKPKPNYKTDLYALGVVLYQLFTQTNPFSSINPVDSVYKHRTLTVIPPSNLNPKMGAALGQVILKLLEKNPNNRLANIEITSDLFNRALVLFSENNLEKTLEIEALSNQVFSIQHFISESYSTQQSELLEIYSQFQQNKLGSVVFLSGENGIQKSQFLNQFYSKIESSDSISITLPLKNDQSTPLSSFRELLKTICNFYLTRPIDELINFQNISHERLGQALGSLHEIYPQITQILPLKSEGNQGRGLDLKSQMIFAIAELLKSFVQSQKSVLIHFRGFHFTTKNTLGIIEGILKELPLDNLFFVFTYENDSLEELQKNFIEKNLKSEDNLLTINQLELISLKKEQVKIALGNAKVSPEELDWASEILMAKTNGLPVFLNRSIEDLAEDDKIRFNTKTSFWHFEKESLLALMNYSGNMADFYQKQLMSFSNDTQQILFYASLIGDVFSKNILSEVYEKTDFEDNFEIVVQEGILKSNEIENQYVFADTEFRKTCFNLLEKSHAIEDVNLKIIAVFLKNYPEIEKSDYFYIFLNKLLQLPPSKAKPYRQWIEMGYEFCQNIADFELAFRCSELLIKMVSDEDWKQNQSAAFQAHTDFLKTSFLIKNFENADALYQSLLPKTQNEHQFLQLTFEYIIGLAAKQDFKRSMDICIAALKKVKINISDDPSLIRIIYSSVRMSFLMKGRDYEFFKNLPPIHDQATIYKILLLQSIVGSAFIVNPKMISELIYKQADFSIKNGFSINLGVCMACFAFTSANFQAKYDDSKRFFDLGQKLNEIVKDSRTYDVNMFIYSCFIQPWFDSFKVSSKQLLENFYHCRQSGYPYFASYNTIALPVQLLFGEIKIEEIKKKSAEVTPFIIANLPKGSDDNIKAMLFFCKELERNSSILKNETESYAELTKRVKNDADITKKLFLISQHFYMCFIKESYSIERDDILFCQKNYTAQGKGYYQKRINFFYVSINFLKANRKLDRFETKFVSSTISELNNVAQFNPSNFETKAFFINGLNHLREKEYEKASLFLQKALESATKYEYPLMAGLAAKELGKLYQTLGLQTFSLEYSRTAIRNFEDFGAGILADKIIEKYPVLKVENEQKREYNISQKIDIESFIKASTSISAEIKLEGLLEKMMVVLVENAGAENVFFIVPDASGFQLIASKTKVGIDNSQHILLDEKTAPISILHYVMRSQASVLLENASQNPIYKNDFYIKNHSILSVLCLPVIKNKQLIGIIYLENNLIPNAFSNENTDSLALLASQIAISFENSQLYDNLENKVRERTNELMIEKDKSEKLLLNILPSEVANELKEMGHSDARMYNHVTVLFADFVNFTKLSEKLSPQELIDDIDEYFKAFDLIMEECGLEKIKTIGDAYLAVCGLPIESENHAKSTAKAAKAMMQLVDNLRVKKKANNEIYFDIRIGLHSGSVIAGIVGLKKFAYDIWGDTVNTAARMEQSCEPNKINISSSTYELIKDEFTCQHRGKIVAKNKGKMDMYYME